MKLVTALIGILLLLGTLSPLSAQIRENEASVVALAVQCSISSGYSADDYEEYCRRLAKTLGMLSGEQQTRVFGYLPQPAAVASPGSQVGALGGIGNSSSGASSSSAGSNSGTNTGTSGSSGSSTESETNALVSLVGGLNNLLDGNVEVNATVVAGSSEDSFSATAGLTMDNTTTEVSGSTGSKSSGGLSDFLAWLSSLFPKG